LSLDQENADPLVLEQQVCYALGIAARNVVAAYKPLLEPLGLTHPQYLAMVALWQHGPLQVKELGALLSLDSGTLSPLLKRLDGMGLVSRRRSSTDERQVMVAVTDEGRRLHRPAQRVHEEIVRRLGLADDELADLQSVLARVQQATAGTAER
jgi:DNA-binding MarR family transcriptional regulator